nr:immunoglobulin heavy chain junction region [Macaca mulatta]
CARTDTEGIVNFDSW